MYNQNNVGGKHRYRVKTSYNLEVIGGLDRVL